MKPTFCHEIPTIPVCRRGATAAIALLALAVAVVRGGDLSTELEYRLLASGNTLVAGEPATFEVVVLNRTQRELTFTAPTELRATIRQGDRSWSLPLTVRAPRDPAAIGPGGFLVMRLEGEVPAVSSEAPLELEVGAPASVRGWVAVSAESGAAAAKPEVAAELMPNPVVFGDPARPTAMAHLKNHYAANFAVYEPIYFVYGPDAPAAKFQFSFRYQMAANDGWLARKAPWLRGVMFGYTQRSLWDIEGDSSAFYDTSYLPELGYTFYAPEPEKGAFFTWLGWQAAIQHESNGEDGDDSRSLNVFFIRPSFAVGRLDSWHLLVSPRFLTYLNTSVENRDIGDYRGYGELRFVFGRNDGPALAFTGRIGKDFDQGAIQLDFTVPTTLFSSNLATFLHVQYWNGYGESLRDYDQRTETVRFGISFVR